MIYAYLLTLYLFHPYIKISIFIKLKWNLICKISGFCQNLSKQDNLICPKFFFFDLTGQVILTCPILGYLKITCLIKLVEKN